MEDPNCQRTSHAPQLNEQKNQFLLINSLLIKKNGILNVFKLKIIKM